MEFFSSIGNETQNSDFSSFIESSNNQRVVKGLKKEPREKNLLERDYPRDRESLYEFGEMTSNMLNNMHSTMQSSSPNIIHNNLNHYNDQGAHLKIRKNMPNVMVAQLEREITEVEKLCRKEGNTTEISNQRDNNSRENQKYSNNINNNSISSVNAKNFPIKKRGQSTNPNQSTRGVLPIMETLEENEGSLVFFNNNPNQNQNYYAIPNPNYYPISNPNYYTNINHVPSNQVPINHLPLNHQSHAYPPKIEKTIKNNKKISIEERVSDKEAIQEYVNNFYPIQKQYQEKKEKLKHLSSLSKLYEKLYSRIEENKIKLPNILEKYLEDYLKHLNEYNEILSLHDTNIDMKFEENETRKERVREKFKF